MWMNIEIVAEGVWEGALILVFVAPNEEIGRASLLEYNLFVLLVVIFVGVRSSFPSFPTILSMRTFLFSCHIFPSAVAPLNCLSLRCHYS